ncbi:MAG TPA: FadR/GntR family transcriptional regulator [Propylenella sp.]
MSGKTGTPSPPYSPIRPRRSLTNEVVERIRADIAGGKLPPGARLHTEQEMIAAFQVSRTVVREAVAALRAEGLVATRQGVGAFVVEDSQPRPFSIAPGGLASIEEVLFLMELRTGVETEAAGLAAERATRRDIRALDAALETIDEALDRGDLAIPQDFAFHRCIAEATGNPQFPRFLEFLGRYIIPRQSVRIAAPDAKAYLATIQQEHRDIVSEVRRHSAAGAQAAMRRHLTNSRERYARLAGKGARRGE